MRRFLPLIVAAAVLSGCAATLPMSVTAYQDPEASYESLRRFAFKPSDRKNPLLEKQLFALVRRKLETKGLVYDQAAPDFLVALNSYSGPYRYYVPQTVTYEPRYKEGDTEIVYGQVGDKTIATTRQTAGKWVERPVVHGGHEETAYRSVLKLDFLEPRALSRDKKVRVLWTGEAQSSSDQQDIRVVAPLLLDELLDEFPQGTGRPTQRERKVNDRPAWSK